MFLLLAVVAMFPCIVRCDNVSVVAMLLMFLLLAVVAMLLMFPCTVCCECVANIALKLVKFTVYSQFPGRQLLVV